MEMHLRIDFYSEVDASVRIEPEISHQAALRVFGLYTLRQFSNQGSHKAADALARRLSSIYEELSSIGSGYPRLKVDDGVVIMEGWPRLVSYRGKGKKRFEYHILSDGKVFLNHHGFGLFGSGIPHYANFSVLALFRHLLEKHQDVKAYNIGLCIVAAGCGEFHLERQITITNQADLVSIIMEEMVRYAASYLKEHDPDFARD